MSGQTRRISDLSEAKLNLLAERLAKQGRAVHPQDAIPLASRTGPHLPTSFAQDRMWFFNQLDPLSPAFNIPFAVRLTGPLNVPALEQSLNELVRRHEALRTSFQSEDGKAVQVIAERIDLPLEVVDLRSLDGEDRESEARRLAQAESARPFDLAQPPLLRIVLLRLSKEEHVALLTMHHIISDGWSTRVLIQEMGELYECFCLDRPSPLPELPIQYADFAVWQRNRLQGDVLNGLLSYWKGQLGGKSIVLDLPTDRARRPMQGFNGASKTFHLAQKLTAEITRLSRHEGVTLFMTLLAALKVLLQRYSGQDNIPVATIIANRNRREIEGLIGLFVNSLILRTDLSGNLTFRELLSRVRKVTLDAYAHQDLPIEVVLEALNITRDTYTSPLCQVMFIFQNVPLPKVTMAELSLSLLETNLAVSRFDMTWTMMETEHGLAVLIDYRTDLFDEWTISQMAERFRILLDELVSNPDKDIRSFEVSKEKEKHALMAAFNDSLD